MTAFQHLRGSHPRRLGVMGLVALLLLSSGPLRAQSPEPEEAIEPRHRGLLWLPILYYTPETKIAAGGAVQYYFRASDTPDARPSTIAPVFIYTQKSQIMLGLFSELYLQQENYRLKGAIGFRRYPDKFHGVGNNTLDDAEEDWEPQYIEIGLSGQRRISTALYAGLSFQYQDTEIRNTQAGGIIETGSLVGRDGGVSSGAGVLLSWDTRDNLFSPSSGRFHELSATFYGDLLGSDFQYQRYGIDLRHYLSLGSHRVVAVRGFAELTGDTVPFYNMPQLGGSNILRGYFEGRFRDRNLLALQAEYRAVPVVGRFGLVGFVELGEVAHKIREFQLNGLKLALGGGFRFLLDPQEKITLRLDFGFGENTSGFYLNFGEAF